MEFHIFLPFAVTGLFDFFEMDPLPLWHFLIEDLAPTSDCAQGETQLGHHSRSAMYLLHLAKIAITFHMTVAGSTRRQLCSLMYRYGMFRHVDTEYYRSKILIELVWCDDPLLVVVTSLSRVHNADIRHSFTLTSRLCSCDTSFAGKACRVSKSIRLRTVNFNRKAG
jgi:hypothetical protein